MSLRSGAFQRSNCVAWDIDCLYLGGLLDSFAHPALLFLMIPLLWREAPLSDSEKFTDERIEKGKPAKRHQYDAGDVVKLLILSSRREYQESAERQRDDDDDPACAPFR